MISRILLICCLLAAVAVPATSGELRGAYTDPRYQTSLPFGTMSHWIQPWRSTFETVPAQQFLDGLGIVFNTSGQEKPELVAEMLARHGIRNARIEIAWGNLDYDTESLHLNDRTVQTLLACQRNHIRPLVLLNGHHGAPGPTKFFDRVLTKAAAKGDRTVTLDNTDGLVIGRSGLNNLTDYWAAEALITAIDGNVVTLSKPLPKDIVANTKLPMATLKYRPFSDPTTSDYRETLAGWTKYTNEVVDAVTAVVGTGLKPDKGFDLEIWNEMSFGSNFVYINKYYEPQLQSYNQDSVWSNIVRATADTADASPARYAGVLLCDGFSNTLPWQASSTEPLRVHALSHHPYAGRKTFPKDSSKTRAVDALLNEDKSGFVPAYSEDFPEYFGTALQTETSIRDMSTITTDLYGTKHGKFARKNGSVVVPCPMWITEVNYGPDEDGVSDPKEALRLKGKTTARYYCFYLGKGTERVYLYDTQSGDKGLGIVQDNFLEYTKSHATYPMDDTLYVSPALAVTGRIASHLRAGLDSKVVPKDPLAITSISDKHDHAQFLGDNTPAHPPLFDRDVLAILPLQVNAHKWVIPYYVMTRDIKQSLAPERFEVGIMGLSGSTAAVNGYDPITDRPVSVRVVGKTTHTLTVSLLATDAPRLLEITTR